MLGRKKSAAQVKREVSQCEGIKRTGRRFFRSTCCKCFHRTLLLECPKCKHGICTSCKPYWE